MKVAAKLIWSIYESWIKGKSRLKKKNFCATSSSTAITVYRSPRALTPLRVEAIHILWLICCSLSQLFSTAARSSSVWQLTLSYFNVMHRAGLSHLTYSPAYLLCKHRNLSGSQSDLKCALKLNVTKDRHDWIKSLYYTPVHGVCESQRVSVGITEFKDAVVSLAFRWTVRWFWDL